MATILFALVQALLLLAIDMKEVFGLLSLLLLNPLFWAVNLRGLWRTVKALMAIAIRVTSTPCVVAAGFFLSLVEHMLPVTPWSLLLPVLVVQALFVREIVTNGRAKLSGIGNLKDASTSTSDLAPKWQYMDAATSTADLAPERTFSDVGTSTDGLAPEIKYSDASTNTDAAAPAPMYSDAGTNTEPELRPLTAEASTSTADFELSEPAPAHKEELESSHQFWERIHSLPSFQPSTDPKDKKVKGKSGPARQCVCSSRKLAHRPEDCAFGSQSQSQSRRNDFTEALFGGRVGGKPKIVVKLP